MEIRIKKRVSAVLIIALLCAQLVPGIRISSSSKEIDDKYIEIRTLNDLLKIQSNPDGKYILMDDIDLSSYKKGGSADTGHGWTPIDFHGVLNGNGHRIDSLTIYGNITEKSNRDASVGLFTAISSDAFVYNLSLTNVNIDVNFVPNGMDVHIDDEDDEAGAEIEYSATYPINVGALAGTCYKNCVKGVYVDGSIKLTNQYKGDAYVGGIVGDARGDDALVDCINNSSVSFEGIDQGDIMVGGIAGSGHGSYEECLIRCVNIGKVNKKSGLNLGSIIGNKEYGGTDCYFLDNNVDAKSSVRGCTCVTQSTMEMEGSYKNFDFEYTWTIDKNSSCRFPQLKGNRADRILCVSWDSLPSKLSYMQGERIDVSDARIVIEYEKGGKKTISVPSDSVLGFHPYIVGTQSVKVQIDNKSVMFDVTVTKNDGNVIFEKSLYDYVISPNDEISINPKYELTKCESSDEQVIASYGENDNDGYRFKAVRNGAAIITATAKNGIVKTYSIMVVTAVNKIKVDKKQVELKVGETVQITVTVDPPDAGLVWSSSDEKVANVVNGKITAVGSGTAKIKVQSGDKIAEVTVTVNGDGSSVSNPTASPGEASETSTPTPTAKPNSVKKPGKVIGLKVKRTKKKITGKTVKVWNKYTWDKVKGCDGYRIEVYYDYKRLNGDDPIWHLSKGWYYDEIKKNKRTDLVCEYCHGEYDAYVKVRVRAYVKNKNGKKVFGKWSVVKKTDWKP